MIILLLLLLLIIIVIADQNSFVASKIQKWAGHISVLPDVAVHQPQLAYAKYLQHE